MRFTIRTNINKSYKLVFQHFNLELFKALKPPFMPLEVSQFDGSKTGDLVKLKVGPLKQDWVSEIVEDFENEHEIGFIDVGTTLPAPFKQWRHCHRIININENHCVISDEIEYHSSNYLLDIILLLPMYLQFLSRVPQYKKFFAKK